MYPFLLPIFSTLPPSVFNFFLFFVSSLCYSSTFWVSLLLRKRIVLGMTREGEISVFRAERYYSLTVEDHFSEVFSGHGSKLGQKKENPLHLFHRKPVRKTEAPLQSSEPSWRSREVCELYSTSALSCDDYFPDKKPGFDGKEFRFDAFHGELDGRKLTLPRNLVKNKLGSSPSHGDTVKEDHFAFPVLKSMIGKLEEKSTLLGEREFCELSWDAIPKAQSFLEDMDSDTSSDLFEIDTLSVSGQTLTSLQESDCGSSSITAKTGYEPEPSEVSAISADGSAVLDCAETKMAAKNAAQMKSTAEKDLRRSKSSKLLGCKSHKAVTVVETAHRTTKIKKTKSNLRAKNMSILKL